VRDGVNTTATFLLRRYFIIDSILTEALLIQSLSQDNGVFQPSVEYEWRTNIRFFRPRHALWIVKAPV
jgi:hypothetical protein